MTARDDGCCSFLYYFVFFFFRLFVLKCRTVTNIQHFMPDSKTFSPEPPPPSSMWLLSYTGLSIAHLIYTLFISKSTNTRTRTTQKLQNPSYEMYRSFSVPFAWQDGTLEGIANLVAMMTRCVLCARTGMPIRLASGHARFTKVCRYRHTRN